MLPDLLLVAAGLAALTAGGEALIRGALALAARWGLSPLLCGLLIVGFGTSAPELAVSSARHLPTRASGESEQGARGAEQSGACG